MPVLPAVSYTHLDVLESVDRRKIIPRLIADYYTCFDHVYGELGVYTPVSYTHLAQLAKRVPTVKL